MRENGGYFVMVGRFIDYLEGICWNFYYFKGIMVLIFIILIGGMYIGCVCFLRLFSIIKE